MKLPVLSINFIKSPLMMNTVALILSILIINTAASADQNGGPGDRTKKVIVLDAGHGGHDTGAEASGGVFEKNVTMAFVKILAEKLKAHHHVHLTRTDDYWVDLADRAALANHLEADLFLSIHTGASLLRNPNGMLVSYFGNSTIFRHPSHTSAPDMSDTPDCLPLWETIKPEDTEKSRYLAELLKGELKKYNADLHVDIQGIPIFVLEGADQPALMIEIGYLTNPSDLQKLQDDERLRQYADVVDSAVDAFFQKISIDND